MATFILISVVFMVTNSHDVFSFCVKVKHYGQTIGAILAETQPQAQRAAKAVKITYEDLPKILTIEVRHYG